MKPPKVSIVIPTHNRKEMLIRLIRSILNSDYPLDKLEIIVVDDASSEKVEEDIRKIFKDFPGIKVIRNEKEMYVSASRNRGLKEAEGKYVFFIDDDNVVDRECIRELVRVLEENPEVGEVGPVMYYLKDPKRIWCAGVRRNRLTSIIRFVTKLDGSEDVKESDDFPNAFMVRKEILDKIGGFDEKNFPIHFEESDLAERVKKEGYKVVCNPKAKVWHDISPEEAEAQERYVRSEMRAYYLARNKILLQKKHSSRGQFLAFLLLFSWVLVFFFLLVILLKLKKPFRDKIKIVKAYLRGIRDGIERAREL